VGLLLILSLIYSLNVENWDSFFWGFRFIY